jgi:PAS domain S-box-containing protein
MLTSEPPGPWCFRRELLPLHNHPTGMGLQDSTDQPQISLAYLPPTPRQARSALAAAAVLLLGLAVLAPFAAKPLPQVNGFIPALDAIIFVTDLITASLLLAHFSVTRQRAVCALACGYLFSAAIVVAHGLTFPGPFSPPGYLDGSSDTNFRLYLAWNFRFYLLWHLGLPAALFAYVWFRDKDRTKAGAHTPIALVVICTVAGVLALASCTAWLATAGDEHLPSAVRYAVGYTVAARWLTECTMLICAAAVCALWVFQRSALDQWLMVVMLASIVELAITSLFGGLGPRFTLGFYTGRVFSLVTSTVVLTALLAETTRLYARLARANMLASVVKASQALSSEIELPKLIERLMTIALENAGADRGVLILPARDEYLIQAEARATGNQIEVLMRQEPITRITCPESLVRYVIRTKESVILDDASKPNPFSANDYLHDRQTKSTLCLPLIKQRELTGILLLENTLTSHAFTADRIAVLELLAAQAAISLENTRLYSDLQEREAKVRRLVDSNIIGILIGNLDGHVQEANQAFLQIVGYDQADVAAGRLRRTELTPPEWHDLDAQAGAEMTTIGTAQPYEKEYFRKDGSRVPVLVGGATFGERRDAVVAFVVDLTERKCAQEEHERLSQLESDLAHMNRLGIIGEQAASLTHEITQPIAAARNNARAALNFLDQRPPGLGEVREALACVVGDADRAGEIIDRIRDHIRKAPPRKARFDLNHAIDEVIVLGRSAITKNGVSVQTRFVEGWAPVEGDRVQLQQVILNLVLNAVEAMSSVEAGPRELLISTEQTQGNGVLVMVGDSGPGIDLEHVDRVFETFYTTKTSGMGMGLSICRSIIDAHGGRLWADANEPRGAVFQFTLPGTGNELIDPLEAAHQDGGRIGRPRSLSPTGLRR